MRYRKSTGFFATSIDLSCFSSHRCIGAKRGLCRRTGKPHLFLSGQRADDMWWTKIAESYPPLLCQSVALVSDNALFGNKYYWPGLPADSNVWQPTYRRSHDTKVSLVVIDVWWAGAQCSAAALCRGVCLYVSLIEACASSSRL